MISLGLQEAAYSDAANANSVGETDTSHAIAPPLTSATRGRRGGDLPYARVDPRWLRSYLPIVNARAKHMVRNNRHAATAAETVPNSTVGSGIHPTLEDPQLKIWRRWSSSRRRMNVSGMHDWTGIQWLVARSRLITGEAFIVMRRMRMYSTTSDFVPIRIEVFDADGLADSPARGMHPRAFFDFGREVGPNGRVLAWHFRIDLGLRDRFIRVPASDVVHVYDPDDCAGRRGISAFSPVVIDLNELAGYQDSTAVKQHLASKLTVITSDPEFSGVSSKAAAPIADLEPGAEVYVEPGRTIEAFEAPLVREYRDFVKSNRDEIAVCIGATPQDLSGDYSGMNYSVARAATLKYWEKNNGHRMRWLRPACEDVYDWVRWAMGGKKAGWPEVDEMDWKMPVRIAIDPDREGIANQRNVRNGFKSWSDVIRDSGRVPERVLAEIAAERAEFTKNDVVFDSDPNQTTSYGQEQNQVGGDPYLRHRLKRR